jgi:hypothetical protein
MPGLLAQPPQTSSTRTEGSKCLQRTVISCSLASWNLVGLDSAAHRPVRSGLMGTCLSKKSWVPRSLFTIWI